MTSTSEWEPYDQRQLLPTINQITHDGFLANDIDSTLFDCPISDDLMSMDLPTRLLSSVETESYRYNMKNHVHISALATRKSDTITAEDLVRLWGIGLMTAKRTIKATTHQCIRTVGTLRRRFRTDRAHMRYKRLSTRHGRFYVDTLFSKVKSIRGYTCGNLFTNTLGFKKFFPLETESQGQKSMVDFIQLVGIPPAIHSDDAKIFQKGEFRKTCCKYGIKQSFTEPYSPWQNRAEGAI